MKNEYAKLTQSQLDAIAMQMDDEIREDLHIRMAPCEPGEFLTAYMELDPEFPIDQFSTEK